MIFSFVLFVIGLVILYFGAEWLIEGASRLALEYGIRPVVIGLTVVALGTSMPEFVVNLFAAYSNESNLALGNIIGSNICNVALILGASALVLPLIVAPQMLRKEYPMMMGAMVLFYVLALDGRINQIDGFILVVGLIGVMTYLFIDARRNPHQPLLEEVEEAAAAQDDMPTWRRVLLVVGGTIFLALGANLMVESAVHIADVLGIDHVIVGLTIVAIGTSLPELAASMVGAFKDEADLSVGNVLGSNLLNVLFVVGFISLIKPLDVEAATLQLHFPIMIGFCLLLLPLAWTGYRITRTEGGVLIAGFLSYMVYLVFPYF